GRWVLSLRRMDDGGSESKVQSPKSDEPYALRITHYSSRAIVHRPSSIVRTTLGLLAAGVLGAAMGAIQVLPFLGVLTASYQWALRSAVHVENIAQPPVNWLLWLSGNGFGWPTSYIG